MSKKNITNTTMDKLVQFILSDDILPEETWKEVPNTNGKYLVSDYGRVVSLCGKTYRILTAYERNGYKTVKINGKHIFVHRLVVQVFINDVILKKKFLCCHHKDSNKHNNNISNLQILTYRQHNRCHHANK